ncbi:hypothetical protein [Salinigranum salinum]|uniref:hypothetical protein n=1 Tax=Salinigranum salinum TaxID=1364937 RepID=UPI001261227D|nr:hypothetical protein [Salinigranum salinum]
MDTHAVSGGGGTGLQVAAVGPTAVASVVLVRGYSQSRLPWRTPFESDPPDDLRLVASDLRGDGESEAPVGSEPYHDPTLWAVDADFRARADALTDGDPVLVHGFVPSLGRLSAFGLSGGLEPVVLSLVTFSLLALVTVGIALWRRRDTTEPFG